MSDEIQTRLELNLEPNISSLRTSLDGPTPPDQLSVLLDISRELKVLNAKLAKPDREAEGIIKRRKERNEKINSYIQGANFVSVIAVFTASLGIAFLSLAHDKFADRDPSEGAKISDHVVYACGFITVVTSLVDVIIIGFLGQSQIMQAVTLNRRINMKVQLQNHARKGEEVIDEEGQEGEGERLSLPGPGQMSSGSGFEGRFRDRDWEYKLGPDDEDEQEWRTLETARSEETFLSQGNLLLSMGPLIIAVEAFVVGTMVLVWSEFALGTAIAVTLSLLFVLLLSAFYGIFLYLYVHAKV